MAKTKINAKSDAGKSTFAVYIGNRGFFPASLLMAAREEMTKVLTEGGYGVRLLDAAATRHGAVETVAEGQLFAAWLAQHRDEIDGVILCLPNFGDENGAVTALRDAGVPILVQAYPDELDKLDQAQRRDAFCGKVSVMDVFCQYGVRFTALPPHTVSPSSARFREHLDLFDRVCRVVKGMRRLTVGAIGARTTAFKTVRIDELALQKAGITTETLDLSMVFQRVRELKPDAAYRAARERLQGASCWKGVPEGSLDNLARLRVVLDQIIGEFGLDALALRCWIEMEQQLGITPCVVLGDLNSRGISAACEVDVGNAVAMQALKLASGSPAMCLDWNNNYGEDPNRCILFHCGPVAFELMTAKGQIVDHYMLATAVGKGRSFGCNEGRIRPMPFTFGSMLTADGKLKWYLGEGEFTADPIPPEFFGCAGVAKFPDLQGVLQHVGTYGYRHHVSVTPGLHLAAVREAFSKYLGWDVVTV
jgi:L-fucose isomerase-like protein